MIQKTHGIVSSKGRALSPVFVYRHPPKNPTKIKTHKKIGTRIGLQKKRVVLLDKRISALFAGELHQKLAGMGYENLTNQEKKVYLKHVHRLRGEIHRAMKKEATLPMDSMSDLEREDHVHRLHRLRGSYEAFPGLLKVFGFEGV